MQSQLAYLTLLAATLACPSFAADPYPVEWQKLQPEILEHYSNLIRIDTSNPPGNETSAAQYLKSVLDREGIPSQIFELEPGRGNLVARLKGNGSKRPIVIMGHLDVVGVQKEKWTVDPFSALRKDGYIYGRGSIDDKDKVTSTLMTLLLLKRLKVPLDRDVIFVAEAGEEGDSRLGIGFLVNQHWDDIACEFAITEGGSAMSRDGKVRTIEIATTEKVPRGVRLVAHGAAGHGSRPRLDNAVAHLATAVAKVAANQPPMRLNDTTRTYFERLATVSTPEQADRYNHLTDPSRAPAIEAYFAEHELGHYSILRTSVVPTILKAGFRSNVIPSEAEATLDIRALPDENMPRFYEWLKKLINDPAVEVVSNRGGGREPGAPSRIDSVMFRAFEAAQKTMYPGAITLPTMLTGATDNAQLRAKGVQAYGFGPIIDEKEVAGGGGAHGDDERLRESSLYSEVEFIWRSVLPVVSSAR
ncbi:MAG TPA: M20/M25/M40 family metallo-hydrolase [Bryobacteraceae bacterium]|nr:M20/M25/M40 family metallo-hydrolase [Bryobacteraceae bacterium]